MEETVTLTSVTGRMDASMVSATRVRMDRTTMESSKMARDTVLGS